jgi:hypothetical protein
MFLHGSSFYITKVGHNDVGNDYTRFPNDGDKESASDIEKFSVGGRI